MKGKKTYSISKVDTRIYVKGFSGVLVYQALFTILGAFGVFTVLYLLTGPFIAILIVVPLLLIILVRLSKIQNTLGPDGYEKKRIAQKLSQFISCKRAIKKHLSSNINRHEG